MNKVVISITGHRLLTAQQKIKITPVLKRAIENIMFTCTEHDPATKFTALSPLAEGADTIFAKLAISLGLPLKAMLPFEREEYISEFSSDKARHEFDLLYDNISAENKRTVGTATGNELNPLYLEMGKTLVNESDYLISIWNEKPGHGRGGTADIVTYALEKQKHILLINPDDDQPHINYLHKDTYKRKDNREIIDTTQTNQLVKFITDKRMVFEKDATMYNQKYKRIWTFGFVIGLVEVLAFSIFISFHVALTLHFILASVEFLCILTIILLVLFGQSKKMHSRYVHYRIICERLRIKKFFAELGLRIYNVSVSPIYFSFKEKPEYGILDNTITLNNLSAYSYMPLEEKKKLLDAELLKDQYKYHERKMEQFERKNNLYKNVRQVLFLLFATAVTLHFAHVANEFFLHHGVHFTSWSPAIFHYELFDKLILFVSIFIPATIAACEALKYLYEWEKIITLSASMANYFKEMSKKLEQIHTDKDLEIFANSINKDMLIENLDWEKYMHDKNEVPT